MQLSQDAHSTMMTFDDDAMSTEGDLEDQGESFPQMSFASENRAVTSNISTGMIGVRKQLEFA
jgi:hypothetical protein